ncbi:MAG: hypothetical protein KatS3mg075_293 [Meiothermus sp.]|nr:MAG: hypothetical protein KatS3mg075_293 [Meiothermus sp.]
MQRTVFIVSDHTGLTAESVARSLLAQFESVSFRYVTRPFTDTEEEVHNLVYEINSTFEREQIRPIVFSTLESAKKPIVNHQELSVITESRRPASENPLAFR